MKKILYGFAFLGAGIAVGAVLWEMRRQLNDLELCVPDPSDDEAWELPTLLDDADHAK